MRAHLEYIEKVSGRRDPLLDQSKAPPGSEYLLAALWRIKRGGRVTAETIRSYWEVVLGVPPMPWEAELLFVVDERLERNKGGDNA